MKMMTLLEFNQLDDNQKFTALLDEFILRCECKMGYVYSFIPLMIFMLKFITITLKMSHKNNRL